MILSDIAIDRRTSVYVLLVLITVFGLYSWNTLPRESNPEIVIPIILVTTTYEGVAPSDMESLITIPIERKLTGISGVKDIESTSAEGISFIQIEFDADENIDAALQKVRDKVDQAEADIPVEADDPQIEEINISDLPVMFLSLTGEVSPAILTEFAEDLEDEIESIKGILDARVVGGVEREIQIIVDPDRATEYGVSMADLVVLAQVENVNTPAGSLELGDAKFLVRVPGEFKSADEIRDLVVKSGPDGVVYIRDIAEVKDGFKDIETISRLDGRQCVTLTISKRAGENIIRIADQVRATVEEYKKRLMPGMDIVVTMDNSVEIRNMVSELENNILSGLILVVGIILIFMGFTNSIMVALAIPLSMLITFFALYITDTTLNMVVLFSLILALGMLVDNGIVVVENIYRHVQLGVPPLRAAKQGAAEVAWPIIGSTLTTIVAFVPMFFWPGVWGSFMFFLPQTVILALSGSLFVGLVVNPALAVVTMSHQSKRAARQAHKHHLVLRAYASVLRLALRWRAVTVTIYVMVLIVIVGLFSRDPKIEFVPETEPYRAFIDIDCAEGARLEVTDAVVRQVEQIVEEHRADLEFVIANVGSRGVNQFSDGSGGSSHIGRVTMDFPDLAEGKKMPSRIIEEVRARLGEITGAEIRIEESQEGPSSDPPVNVEISGDDFTTLADLAQRVSDRIRDVPNLVDLRDDYEKGKPEIRVQVDRQQALLMGLNTEFIGKTVMAAVQGRKAGDYREGDEEYDVTVRFPKEFRDDLGKLESLALVNLGGKPVPFSAVARLEQGNGYGSITRIDRKRTITVSADTDGMRSGAEVLVDARRRLDGFPLPNGYSISYTGENEEQEEAQAFLGRAFIAALFLIMVVLVAQFNSIAQSAIVMTSVVLSLTGVFLGLYIHNMPFSVIMTGIGCISLAGVVVNNAIVLIDFINEARKAGTPVTEAIVQAGVTRFRPVMLTAVTTVLGLVPMAMGISYDFRKMEWIIGGESSQWWGSMAIAVIYGLSFATLLTLIVVPTLYSLTDSLAGLFRRERAETEA